MTTGSPQSGKIRVLAVTTYELGHQPLVLARLASTLGSAGIQFAFCDNSVERRSFSRREDFLLQDGEPPTDLIISVPMHTATKLGREIAVRARGIFGDSIRIIAVGLYSKVALASSRSFDAAVFLDDPKSIIESLGATWHQDSHLSSSSSAPDRSMLPGLGNYAYLIADGGKKLVGYVETTIGCAHMCKHCPVPVVFKGRFRAVSASEVLTQIDQLHSAGARHITFGDPDFLNGPAHALRIVRSMHAAHPELTFDATVKVEHILEYRGIWHELRALGLSFVVSAFEHTSDDVLHHLAKGHTRADIVEALSILREQDIDVRPSLIPFTPWTSKSDLLDLFEFIYDHDLVGSIDPVQLSIRLLVPLESLLLDDISTEFGQWNPELLSYQWTSSDPGLDDLHEALTSIAEDAAAGIVNNINAISLMREAAYRSFNLSPPLRPEPSKSCECRPKLSESWFCCAEPTKLLLDSLGGNNSLEGLTLRDTDS